MAADVDDAVRDRLLDVVALAAFVRLTERDAETDSLDVGEREVERETVALAEKLGEATRERVLETVGAMDLDGDTEGVFGREPDGEAAGVFDFVGDLVIVTESVTERVPDAGSDFDQEGLALKDCDRELLGDTDGVADDEAATLTERDPEVVTDGVAE